MKVCFNETINKNYNETKKLSKVSKPIIMQSSSLSAYPLVSDESIFETVKYAIQDPSQAVSKGSKSTQAHHRSNQIKSANQHTYHRGTNPERLYYNQLIQKVDEFSRNTKTISKLSPAEMFEYKNKYLNEYLLTFFKNIGEECLEKEIYAVKLWESIREIFEELIKRLIKEINGNEKKHLSESLNTHTKYQSKFIEMTETVHKKNEEIEKYKEIIANITNQNKKKSRKNKEITNGIVKIVGRLGNVEKQRNELEIGYVNMLTLGYQGGMDYEEAKKYTINKFELDNEDDASRKETENYIQKALKMNSFINEVDEHSDNGEDNNKKGLKKLKSLGNSSDKFSEHRHSLYKAKKKFIYDSRRMVELSEDNRSDDDEWISKFLKAKEKQNKKKRKNRARSSTSFSGSDSGSTKKEVKEKEVKVFKSIEIQVSRENFYGERDDNETNLGVIEKYRDNWIKNKEVQTETIQHNPKVICFDTYTQCDQTQIVNKLSVKSLPKGKYSLTEVKKEGEYSFDERVVSRRSEIKTSFGLKREEERIYDELETLSDEEEEKENDEIKFATIIKKEKQNSFKDIKRKSKNSKMQTCQTEGSFKKGSRPSIFKRASMMISPSGKGEIYNNLSRIQVQYKNSNIRKSEGEDRNKRGLKSSFLTTKESESQLSGRAENKNSTFEIDEFEEFQENKSDSVVSSLSEQEEPKVDIKEIIEKMNKLSSKSFVIDESMAVLLQKSLLKIKAEKSDNVESKNERFIRKIKRSSKSMVGLKNKSLMSTKAILKLITCVLDSAYLQMKGKKNNIYENGKENMKKNSKKFDHNVYAVDEMNFMSISINPAEEEKKRKRGSILSIKNDSIGSEMLNEEFYGKETDLLDILRKQIKKDHPLYKENEIEHKIAYMLRSMVGEQNKNYLIKNFMLLSCLDESIFSCVIFASDIELYLTLIFELSRNSSHSDSFKVNNKLGNHNGENNKEKICNDLGESEGFSRAGKSSHSLTANFETFHTNIQRLKNILPKCISKFYNKPSLISFVSERIEEAIEKIEASATEKDKNISNKRLDVFKCCQMIMESIFAFKIEIIKSYSQLIEVPMIAPFECITEDLFVDILGFTEMNRVSKEEAILNFRSKCTNYQTKGANLLSMVNFCLAFDFPDFDEIILNVIEKYHSGKDSVSSRKTEELMASYSNFDRIGPICQYLYFKNSQHDKNNRQFLKIPSRIGGNKSSEMTLSDHQKIVNNTRTSTFSLTKNSRKSSYCEVLKDEESCAEIWQTIGIGASNCLIHSRVVELESENLLEMLLGPNLIEMYVFTLDSLLDKLDSKESKIKF